MLRNLPRWIETLATRYVVAMVLGSLCLPILGILGVLHLKLASLAELAMFVDASLKTSVALVGCIWALNRFFVQRTDIPQIRVDADVNVVRFDSEDKALLVFRLDLINTGKTLVPGYRQFIEVQSVEPGDGGPAIETLYRWPSEGTHKGGPIEPGSWAAINDQLCCRHEICAARIYLEVRLPSEITWTWHKTFDVSEARKWAAKPVEAPDG